MILKKLISAVSAVSIIASSFAALSVRADEQMSPIACTQSASFLSDGDGNVTQAIVNYSGKEDISNINWNTASNSWGGTGVLEFVVPAAEAKRIKSAELTVSVHNGSSRSGGRTYDIYPADITIDADMAADALKAISLAESMYQAEGVKQGETRTDKIATEAIREYVKSKVAEDAESIVQFAFSNSSQTLDIDPKTATLALTMYDGGVALDKNELILSTSGEPQKLTYSIFGACISDSDLVWISENEDIAAVDSTGLVTPKKAGKTVVSVKTTDGSFKADCAVTVLQAAENITIDKSSLSLIAGGKNGELTAKLLPETAVKRQIKWLSSNEVVATVSSNGIITPLSVGETVITATAADNEALTASCTVTVTEMIQPDSISLDKETVSLPKLGATTVVNANIQPSNADDRITWTSSDTKIAQVYDGVIVAGEVGTAEITATTSNGKTAKCTITVTEDKQLITNDRFYTDTNGNILYSQGGGIFKFPNDDKYYWYGVRYKEAVTYAADPLSGKTVEHPAFDAYTCYTSDDLVNWKYEGDVATLETLGQTWCGWAGRCGVVYNEKANKYVLVSQFNGTIIASADNPLGPFKTEKGYFWGGTSLPVIANGDTGDLTMFYDEDGKGYMICSSANGRGHLYIAPMDEEKAYCDFDFDNIKELSGSTDSYFDEDGSIKKKDKGGIEGDCMFKYKGHYYFTGSDLYGWRGSRVYVFESEDILGNYKLKPDYIDASKSSSNLPYIMPGAKYSYAHNSQTGFYYTLHGSKQDTVIYCGDRWCDFGTHGIGYNQWVPLTMDGYTPHFNDLSQWRLDSETGEWTIGDGNNYIANNEFDADRVDVTKLTGWEHTDSVGGTAGGNVKARRFYGNYAAKHSAAVDYTATMKQTIKDLPDGTYTLRASVMSSGGQNECVLYANADDKKYTASLKSKMSEWTDIVIKDIVVENGECEVGLYIFKGWQVNDDTENLIDDLNEYKITADTKFTAVYEKDTAYIEPIVSAQITGNSLMTFGDSPDTAAENEYTLTLTGQAGTVITADTIDSRIEDFNIEWDIDGFKTVNDTDKYCDSYGEFAEHTSTATDVSFMLRQCDFNFYGKLKATITYNGETLEASMYVAALGNKSMANNRVLPEAGYPSDFDEYPDSLVGYTVLKDTYGGNDIMVGGWGMSGSDSGNAVIMEEDNNKFIRINCPNSSKSHMFTNSIEVPEKQIIFEQNIRFNGNGCITLTSKQPYWTDKDGYTTPVTLEFDGTTIKLNGTAIKKNDVDVTADKGKWYKIVLSADKTTESCFAKVYDLENNLVGETESVAWTEASEPTYYSIGCANKVTGTVDFDAYKAYYPTADASTYTLSASQTTLSIPNKDTAALSASVKSAEGCDITGAATWTVLEEDMQSVIITPDKLDSHKATVTLGEGASAGEATVQVSIGGYTKTVQLNITDSAESIKFTSSQSSVAIPLDEKSVTTAKYSAAVINGDGADLGKNVTLEIYDRNNMDKYTLPDGVSFDASKGIVSVTSAAVPCVFTVRATGESSDGKTLSRSVKVTVHGLSFDFGSGEDESVTEGYTDVNPQTTYTEQRGYGIEGSVQSEGTPSIDNASSDYLSGDFTFKAKVTKGKLYKVKVAFSGDLVSEYVSPALSGHERTLEAEGTTHTGYTVKTAEITEQTYDIPVVDDVLDLKFTGASVAYITIEKVEKTAAQKPNIWSVGDSTIGNNGSYAYNLARDQANYPELTALADYHNNGKGSRNLKTYYTQGWLDNILINIRPGDIVTVGNMGTNPGGMSGSEFKAPLDYYVDACLAMGAKVILTSYTPHGCVEGYEYVYDKTTHTFHGCREDAYDSLGIRVIYAERKDNPDILGFIDIGLNADNAFNEYVADYAKNGYADENAAAQAIIDCFGDHNHYGNAGRSQLAGDLMLNGYGITPGIVSELVRILTESANRPCVKIEAVYDDNGILVNVTVTPAKVSEAQSAVRSKNSLVTYWYSLESMQPVISD